MDGFGFTVSDMQYVLLASGVIFLGEAATGALKGAKARDFAVTALCFACNSLATRPLAALAIASLASFAAPSLAGSLSGAPFWPSVIGVILAAEFAFYWVHRIAHGGQRAGSAFGFLWKMHRTHHSASHLNVSVSIRQNIFWAFIVPHAWALAISLYLGIGSAAVLALMIIYAWNLITHTNLRWDRGLLQSAFAGPFVRGLGRILVLPSMHHSHHGFGPEGKMYCNHGVFLSLYDWIFGTLYLPNGPPARYGVPGDQPHWAEEAFFPVVQVKAKAAGAKASSS